MKTSPCSVNFTAFEPRLVSTCASRVGSPASTSGTSGSQDTISSRPLARAGSASMLGDLVEDRPDLEVEPLELELARLDLGEVEDVVDDGEQRPAGDLDARRQPLLVGVSGVRSSRSLRPITPLSGVRISWLIVARNSDFCRDASMARVAGLGQLALGALALGHAPQLDGDLLDHRGDHVVAVQRRCGRDRDDRADLVGVRDRERDREPRVVPHRRPLVEGPVGQGELGLGPGGVQRVGVAILVVDVEGYDALPVVGRYERAGALPVVVQQHEELAPGRARPRACAASFAAVATACRSTFWFTWSCRAISAALASLMSWCVPDMLTTLPVSSRAETPRPRVHTHPSPFRTRAVNTNSSASPRAALTAPSTAARSSGCTISRNPRYDVGKSPGASP